MPHPTTFAEAETHNFGTADGEIILRYISRLQALIFNRVERWLR
jgi:hypothetical protein